MGNVSTIFFLAWNSLMCSTNKGSVQEPSSDYVGDHLLVIPQIPGVTSDLVTVSFNGDDSASPTFNVSAERIVYSYSPFGRRRDGRRESTSLDEILSSSKLVVFFARETRCPVLLHCLRYLTSPMVGGKPFEFRVEIDRDNEPLSLLSFSGDKVNVTVDVIRDPLKADSFFENLASQAGPLPRGAQRFAFVFACVDLRKTWTMNSFVKHFPRVPYYGIWSLGEFANPNVELSSDSKRPKNDYVFFRCVSVAIVTILQ